MQTFLASAKFRLLTLAIFAATATAASAQCMSLQPPAGLYGFGKYRWLGNSYRNMSCYNQAQAAYAQMLKEAQALPDSDPMKSTIVMWSPYFQKVVIGLEALQRSDFAAGQANLAEVISTNGPDEMKMPAIMALGDSMVQHFDGKYLPALQSALATWNGGWKTQYFTSIVGLNDTNATDRINGLVQLLGNDLPVEDQLAKNVILLDALSRAGRLAEADLFARSIERDVGRKAWNIDLRIYYMRVCYDLAIREGAAGWDDAASHAATYLAAWRELNAPR